jgi:hypothetical protein
LYITGEKWSPCIPVSLTISYKDFIHECDIGDLLFLRSHTALSVGTRLITGSPFTHCGLFFKTPSGKLMEFGIHSERDFVRKLPIIHRKGHLGLFNLDDLFNVWGNIYWKKLPNLSNPSVKSNIRKIILRLLTRKETPQFANHFEALYNFILHTPTYDIEEQDEHWLNVPVKTSFCSGIVAMILAAAGAIKLTKHYNMYTPADFAHPERNAVYWLCERKSFPSDTPVLSVIEYNSTTKINAHFNKHKN